MKVLFLDPSSTCTGYAIFTDGTLQEAGRLTPQKTRDHALARIRAMGRELEKLADDQQFHAIVVEVSTSRYGRSRKQGGAATLHIYGMAVGYLLSVVEYKAGTVAAVEANLWTSQVGSKELRKQDIARRFRGYYDARRDPGGDVADAVALGEWWWSRRR